MKRFKVIRYERKQVDDVVISCDLFRMERMSKDSVWLSANIGSHRGVDFMLYADKGKLKIMLMEDTIGCKDETQRGKK